MSRAPGARFAALELMQAMQLGHAVAALHAVGVMDALSQACLPEDLARCGRLGSALPADGRLTLVHDPAQLLSAQGVPPARRRDWAALYRAAGARLVHAIEDTQSTRFVHLVAL